MTNKVPFQIRKGKQTQNTPVNHHMSVARSAQIKPVTTMSFSSSNNQFKSSFTPM